MLELCFTLPQTLRRKENAEVDMKGPLHVFFLLAKRLMTSLS